MDKILESKTRRFVRMIFQDVLANLHSRPEIWRTTPQQAIGDWPIPLGESNAGTLQLVCVGIETFGRAVLGYKNESRKAKETFTAFVLYYFPVPYHDLATQLYTCYRCGLLHSHYLGFGSDSGFFPTRGGRPQWDKHLQYTDLAGTTISPTKTQQHNRLIINIETFASDFKTAVEKYLDDLRSSATKSHKNKSIGLVPNLAKSLADFPEEDTELLKQRVVGAPNGV